MAPPPIAVGGRPADMDIEEGFPSVHTPWTGATPGTCYPSKLELYKEYLQSRKRTFKVVGSFNSVLPVLERLGWLEAVSIEGTHEEAGGASCQTYSTRGAITCLSRRHRDLMVALPRLRARDFSALRQPRYDYARQESIQESRIDDFTACAAH